MESLAGDHADDYYKAMDDEIQILMRRDTWDIFQGSQFLITMCFLEHSISSTRVNRIERSGNSRHDIV